MTPSQFTLRILDSQSLWRAYHALRLDTPFRGGIVGGSGIVNPLTCVDLVRFLAWTGKTFFFGDLRVLVLSSLGLGGTDLLNLTLLILARFLPFNVPDLVLGEETFPVSNFRFLHGNHFVVAVVLFFFLILRVTIRSL